jgi:transketolase
MNAERRAELRKTALEVRKDIVRMLGVARAQGMSGIFGAVDILVYLYWEYMRADPSDRRGEDRDRFVLAKAASAPALYSCLANRGYFSREELWSYSRLGATLQGCPDVRTPGVDAPGGASGWGIGVAVGMSGALKMKKNRARVFCLADEEDIDTGLTWEYAASASAERLGSLALIVESDGARSDVQGKFGAFGWEVREADGGDFSSMENALGAFDYASSSPKALIVSRDCAAMSFIQEDDESDIPTSGDYSGDVPSNPPAEASETEEKI